MPVFENMMITISIFLFFTNAAFLFAAFLPGTETGDGQLLNIGVTQSDIQDMNNKIIGLIGRGKTLQELEGRIGEFKDLPIKRENQLKSLK